MEDNFKISKSYKQIAYNNCQCIVLLKQSFLELPVADLFYQPWAGWEVLGSLSVSLRKYVFNPELCAVTSLVVTKTQCIWLLSNDEELPVGLSVLPARQWWWLRSVRGKSGLPEAAIVNPEKSKAISSNQIPYLRNFLQIQWYVLSHNLQWLAVLYW